MHRFAFQASLLPSLQNLKLESVYDMVHNGLRIQYYKKYKNIFYIFIYIFFQNFFFVFVSFCCRGAVVICMYIYQK